MYFIIVRLACMLVVYVTNFNDSTVTVVILCVYYHASSYIPDLYIQLGVVYSFL